MKKSLLLELLAVGSAVFCLGVAALHDDAKPCCASTPVSATATRSVDNGR